MKTIISFLALLALLVISGPARPADLVLVADRDRVEGSLATSDAEVGLTFDALDLSELSVKVKARSPGLEPEVLLFGPDDVEIRLLAFTRHGPGSPKTRVDDMPMPMTGRYTLVVRSRSRSGGDFKLKLRILHPRKIVQQGQLSMAGTSVAVRFPAFGGSRVRFKVRGRNGFIPRAATILTPDVSEVSTGAEEDGPVARAADLECATTGNHRLLVESRDGSTGEWKAKIKLDHPAAPRASHDVAGEPAGTFTDGKEPPDDPPTGGGGVDDPDVQNGFFRVSLALADPPPEPKGPKGPGLQVRSLTYPLDFSLILQNVSGQTLSVQFVSEPWHNLIVRDVSTGATVWIAFMGTLPSAPTVSFAPSDTRIWILRWDLPALGVPAGEYEATAVFHTADPRVPRTATVRFRLE